MTQVDNTALTGRNSAPKMSGVSTPSHSDRSSGFEIVADAAMSRVDGILIRSRATHASRVAPRSSLSMCTSSINTSFVASHIAPQSRENESHCNLCRVRRASGCRLSVYLDSVEPVSHLFWCRTHDRVLCRRTHVFDISGQLAAGQPERRELLLEISHHLGTECLDWCCAFTIIVS